MKKGPWSTFACSAGFLYNENHAIVAWLKRGFADEQKTNKKIAQDVYMPKAPSERELSSECETEGECAHNKKEQILKLRRLLPPLTRSPFLSEEGFW